MTGNERSGGPSIVRLLDGRIVLFVGNEPWQMTTTEARELAQSLIEFARAEDLVQAMHRHADAPELVAA